MGEPTNIIMKNQINNNEIINTVENNVSENTTVNQKKSKKMKNIQSIKMTHRGKKIDVIPVYDTSMRNILQLNKNAL